MVAFLGRRTGDAPPGGHPAAEPLLRRFAAAGEGDHLQADVVPDQHRVGTPAGYHQRTVPHWQAARRLTSVVPPEGGRVQADLTGDRAAERQAGPVEDQRLASPELGLARSLTRTTGGWADPVLPINGTSTGSLLRRCQDAGQHVNDDRKFFHTPSTQHLPIDLPPSHTTDPAQCSSMPRAKLRAPLHNG
jgi:hypothetical protein